MANWCSNRVEFIGEHSQFEYLKVFFEAMEANEKKEFKGQLPAFVEAEDGYLFQVMWSDGILYYETRWTPNTDVIVKIAEHFKVGFVHNYEEIGCRIFGEATYRNGQLTVVTLDPFDFDQYTYDDDNECCVFENQNFDCSDEILEILLDRKKQALATGSTDQTSGEPQ
jgi:hypothetical protein